ncbi:unnamed protein product [Cercospora beticola]|nr:unnamed protein product [Cercospora beticola]
MSSIKSTLLLVGISAARLARAQDASYFDGGCSFFPEKCQPCFGINEFNFLTWGWCHTKTAEQGGGWQCRGAEGCTNPSPPPIDHDPGTCDRSPYICKRCYTTYAVTFGNPDGWCHTSNGQTINGFECRGAEGCTN